MAVYETSSPHSRPPLSSPVGSRVRSEDATPSPASPAQLWSQVSVTPHTQTPLRDALPFESGPCAPFRCPTVGTSVTPLIPLVRSLGAWLELPRPSCWLLRTIRLGYAIQFARHPPKFRGIRFTSVLSKDAPVLRAEVAVLLAKDAIEPVPPAEMKSGFYKRPLLHRTQERRWVTTNPGQGPSCCGISIASSCWQYGLLCAASERCYTRSMYWSARTTLRPLRTSTTRAVYAPVACRNSPAISSFGVRSI